MRFLQWGLVIGRPPPHTRSDIVKLWVAESGKSRTENTESTFFVRAVRTHSVTPNRSIIVFFFLGGAGGHPWDLGHKPVLRIES
jgi:hypothetical protein